MLEEESSTDRDCYIDRDTLDYLAGRGAEASLISALGTHEEMEFRWETA